MFIYMYLKVSIIIFFMIKKILISKKWKKYKENFYMYRYRWSTLKCQTIEPDDGGHLLKWPVVYTGMCISYQSGFVSAWYYVYRQPVSWR